MGMYTELYLAVELRDDIPEKIIHILERMISNNGPNELLDLVNTYEISHPLFKCDRAWFMLKAGSCYFTQPIEPHLNKTNCNRWELVVKTNLKNYDSEIENFIDFIGPYVDLDSHYDEFVGFIRYEENETPTLIYMDSVKKTLVFKNIGTPTDVIS